MLESLSFTVFISFTLGVFGYLFVYKLIQDGEVFGLYGRFIHFLEGGRTPYRKLDSFLKYLAKPLGGCIVCFTGQFSLWISIFHLNLSFNNVFFVVVLSMFTAFVLEKKLY